MTESVSENISNYINSQSRNKIVFHSNEIPGIMTVNLGLRLSETIYNFKELGKISMRVTDELDKILNASISPHNLFGRYLSIANLGILFEPELKLDFFRLLESYSQNNVLFVKWEGEIDSANLYFLRKGSGIKTNIKDLSHIAI